MARIRTIKPEFFMSDDIGELSPLARLLYIALWCQADREGKMKFQRTALTVQCMPFDMDKFDECMGELEAKGHLHSYEVDGRKYLILPTFLSHQRPHGTEKDSEIPSPNGGLTVKPPLSNRESTIGKERERKGNTTSPEPPSDSGPVVTITLNDKTEYGVGQEQVAEWKELYPAVDVIQELRAMKGWANSNPSQRKTRRGILRFINGWLARTQNRGGSKPANSRPVEPHYPDLQA